MKFLLILSTVLILTACVPRSQYATLVTERDYYRQEALTADSIAAARALTASDSTQREAATQRRQIRQIEELTATNINLEKTLRELRGTYEDLLQQNSLLLSGTESEVSRLQEDLRARSAELSRAEAEAERRARELAAREQQVSSLTLANPSRGTSPVDPLKDAVLLTDRLYDEVHQLMLAAANDGYLLVRQTENTLQLSLSDSLLFEADQRISLEGQRLVQRLAATLRNYPRAEYRLVGHAESKEGNTELAYEESFRRAMRVATVLTTFGIDGGRILPAGVGFYGSEISDLPGGGSPDRRTDLIISFPAT
ncbi:OmpA family protein [Lewinella sp. JB7]|uniref:OmpA family protein n=1 Tax=Lewinella sp. JB7 TaxID=2962887 RepID=UPI0020C955AA|nr:OmpA family protein [Lewinella sp. JB7]MCP9235171.1 hypothetical protein [Lewinella sp. JB7]